jgi:hypothetical protein
MHPLRVFGASCLVPMLLGVGPGLPDVSGIYDTRVSLLESSCTFQVESHPTEVAQFGDSSIITLRHAGTTYQGVLATDSSFKTQTKVLDFSGTRYQIDIAGRFTAAGITARVTLAYGDPACRAVVLWEGPRRKA